MEIKEVIKGIGYDKLPAVGYIAPKIEEYILQMRNEGCSINAARIVLILSANLKEKQRLFIGKDKSQQLDLFDNEWLDVNNNKSFSVQLNFKFKDFLPKGSKNYALVRKGLDELQERNQLLIFQRENDKGEMKEVRLKSALISSYLMEEGNGFKMIINNFWFKALIQVEDHYNKFIKNIIFNLSYNSLLFYMYLQTLKEIQSKDIKNYDLIIHELGALIEKPKGTRMKKDTFREKFGIDYKYDSDLKRKVLDVWRSELNNNTDLSFGYSIDDTYITIVTYVPKKTLIESDLIEIEENKIKAAINYKFKNNQLDSTQLLVLLEVYLKYTYQVVFKATERKPALRGLKGEAYVEMFKQVVASYVDRNRIDLSKICYQNMGEMRTNIRKSYH